MSDTNPDATAPEPPQGYAAPPPYGAQGSPAAPPPYAGAPGAQASADHPAPPAYGAPPTYSPPQAPGAPAYGPPPSPYAAAPYGTAPYGNAPYGAAPYAGGYAAAKTNVLAVISMIASIAGFVWILPLIGSVAGVVMAHISLRQIARTGERGRGMALAGLIVGYVGLAFIVLGIIAIIVFSGFAASQGTRYST